MTLPRLAQFSHELDDDHIECNVLYRLREEPVGSSPSPSPFTQVADLPNNTSFQSSVVPHRIQNDGQPAACGLDIESSRDGGLVDCEGCLHLSRGMMVAHGDAESAAAASLLDVVVSAGPEGLPKQYILVSSLSVSVLPYVSDVLAGEV